MSQCTSAALKCIPIYFLNNSVVYHYVKKVVKNKTKKPHCTYLMNMIQNCFIYKLLGLSHPATDLVPDLKM